MGFHVRKIPRIPSATRPWSDAGPVPDADTGRIRLYYPDPHAETCLSCPLPSCPHRECPLCENQAPGRKPGRNTLPIPADFIPRMDSGEAVNALSKRYGVSRSTIYRWKQIINEKGGIPHE